MIDFEKYTIGNLLADYNNNLRGQNEKERFHDGYIDGLVMLSLFIGMVPAGICIYFANIGTPDSPITWATIGVYLGSAMLIFLLVNAVNLVIFDNRKKRKVKSLKNTNEDIKNEVVKRLGISEEQFESLHLHSWRVYDFVLDVLLKDVKTYNELVTHLERFVLSSYEKKTIEENFFCRCIRENILDDYFVGYEDIACNIKGRLELSQIAKVLEKGKFDLEKIKEFSTYIAERISIYSYKEEILLFKNCEFKQNIIDAYYNVLLKEIPNIFVESYKFQNIENIKKTITNLGNQNIIDAYNNALLKEIPNIFVVGYEFQNIENIKKTIMNFGNQNFININDCKEWVILLENRKKELQEDYDKKYKLHIEKPSYKEEIVVVDYPDSREYSDIEYHYETVTYDNPMPSKVVIEHIDKVIEIIQDEIGRLKSAKQTECYNGD